MIIYHNQWALVTGASSGIGEEFAWRLAARGVHLILTARRKELLDKLAAQIHAHHGVRVETIAADLAQADAPAQLFEQVQALGVPVRILVNNAGFGVYGRFDETPMVDNQRLIMVNIHALMSITHLFLPAMKEAREGYIFHIASIAGFQPVAYMANYAASKAFVLSFSEALWAEYRHQGVRILAVCPGATETNFFDVMGSRIPAAAAAMDTTENVVKTALLAMEKRKCSAVCGSLFNHVLVQLNRLSPRSMVASIGEMMLRPRKKT